MQQNHSKNDFAAFFSASRACLKIIPAICAPCFAVYFSRIQLRQLNPGSIPLLFWLCNITCLIDCKGLLCIIKSVLIHDVDFIIICIHSLKRHRDIFIEIQKCFHMQTNLCCIINIGILRPFKNDLGNLMIIGPYIEHLSSDVICQGICRKHLIRFLVPQPFPGLHRLPQFSFDIILIQLHRCC